MVARMLEWEVAVRKSSHLVPSWQDLEVLESVNSALAPLKDFTDILSGESYVTVSTIKPILRHPDEEVLVDCDKDTQLTKDIKERVKMYLHRKYAEAEVNELICVCCLLDLRFKDQCVNADDLDLVKARVTEEATEILVKLGPEESQNDEQPPAK